MVHGAVLLKAILGGEVLLGLIEEAEMRVLVASEASINEQGRKPLSCVAAAEGLNMAQTNLMNERQQMLRMQACLCLAPPPHLFPFFFPDPSFSKIPTSLCCKTHSASNIRATALCPICLFLFPLSLID